MTSSLWQILGDIAIRAHDASSEDDVFALVGDSLKAHNLHATIGILDESQSHFRVVYASTARSILVAAERLFGARGISYEIPMEESFTLGQAVRAREAVYRRDHLPQPGPRETRLGTIRRGAELLGGSPHIAAPLLARNHVLGALTVQARDLTEADCAPVALFARQVALAIDNLRRSRESANRARQLSIIVQINQTVSSDLRNIDRAYETLLREIRRLVTFDQADLALADLESGEVRLSSPGVPGQSETGDEVYPLAGSVVEWVAAHGQLYICRDTRQDQFTEGRRAAAAYLRSYIALPLRNRGHTHGAFILKSKTPYFYGDSDGSVLMPIVDQMAIALVNFRLFEQVERGRRQLQAVLDSTDDAVLATDAAGHLTLVNPAAERLFRVEASRVLGQPVWVPIRLPSLTDVFRQALAGKFHEPMGIDVPFHSDRFLFAGFAPLRDGRSSLLGWMVVVRDITHFKRLDALKSETIATVAHDLKSPLHLVSGALGVLAEDVALLADDQREALSIAQAGLRRMRLLIDDLLDLKKIEEGFGVVKSDCPVDAVLRSVVSEATAAAAAKEQTLSLDAPAGLPILQADAERLHQAFANLVGNAIKYTQSGGAIHVRAQETGPAIEVIVSDNGPGISPEDQAHIFEKFYRARRARHMVEGTGMGLAIVKSIIEQHGGKVFVHSAPDRGTQFVVSLPVPTE